MTRKKTLIFGGVLLTILLLILAAALPWFLLWFGFAVQDTPKPAEKYGEFPYKLVHEINGEQYTTQNTIVIEYEGTIVTSTGKINQWNRTLKYGKDFDVDGKAALVTNGVSLFREKMENKDYKEVYFYLGRTEYYMGLSHSDDQIQAGDIVETHHFGNHEKVLSEEELYEKYGIKIIEKYISPPITEQTAD